MGSYCATPSLVKACTSQGAYCPAGSTVESTCPAGSFCKDSSTVANCTSTGAYCPAGSTAEGTCTAGSFCASPSEQVQCPKGYYCLAGVTEPTQCPAGADCPAGFSSVPADSSNPPLTAVISLDMDADEFLDTYQEEFKKGIETWLGGGVKASDVTITCVCGGACNLVGGKTPEGEACGNDVASRRALLQSTSTTEVQFEVAMADPAQRIAMEEYAADESNSSNLQVSLVAGGLPAKAAMSAGIDVKKQEVAADINVGLGEVPPPDYSDIIVTVMVAVPVALVVVGLAIYQNTKKPKPMPLGGVIFSIIFAFYDYFSDVWFAVMPTPDPQYQYFTWIAGAVVGVATLVGAGGVYYAMTNHELIAPAPGIVEYVLAVASTTNMEMLSLMPWVDDSVGGLPSTTVAAMPTASVVVEDLPQLMIQGAYLMVSGDTGNIVVLISVGMSACSLLLRFTRSAMAAAGMKVEHSDSESDSDDSSDGTSSDEEANMPERVQAREARREARKKKKKEEEEESTASVALTNILGF